MRTLDEIFTNGVGDGKRTILFEDGLWCLYNKEAERSYIIHRCDTARFALDADRVLWEYAGDGWCCGGTADWVIGDRGHGCGEEVPESVKTLYILHRWDR